jgi:DNA-binding response OmpR family regulator
MTILALSEEEEIYSYPVQKNININSHRAETLAALSKFIENSYNKKEEEHLIQITDTLYYNNQSKSLLLDKEVVKLTKSEYQLFELFLSKKNFSIDTQTILAYVWEKQGKEISTNSVRTLVKKLRKKLIENSYGGYYRLVIKYYTT